MKKGGLVALTLIVLAIPAFAQSTSAPNPAQIGVDTAQQALKEISVSKFEDPGMWRVFMPIDEGIIESRRFAGAPADRKPIPDEQKLGIAGEDKYVLGVKAQFFRRGDASIFVEPTRPLAIPGITKTVSVWVVGRNFNSMLKLVIQDQFGNVDVLDMGLMNFTGWRQLTVAIPPNIQQRDVHYPGRGGISVLGFIIKPNMLETYGSYYVYFDDLRAVTDLFADLSRNKDDIPDTW